MGKQKGEAYSWWNKFSKWILSLLSDEQILGTLTDAFLTRENLNAREELSYGDPEFRSMLSEALNDIIS